MGGWEGCLFACVRVCVFLRSFFIVDDIVMMFLWHSKVVNIYENGTGGSIKKNEDEYGSEKKDIQKKKVNEMRKLAGLVICKACMTVL